MLPLILASSSPYRREVLAKLGLPFEHYSPDIDENPLPNESPEELVRRLAIGKTQAVANHYSNTRIIGSDQVALFNNRIITKPHTHENAIQQLQRFSSHKVTFLTSLCLFNSSTQHQQIEIVPYHVQFLPLTNVQIETYLQREQPYDCAGSFKSEGLGISLFESLEGTDPNSLIGLPLIALTKMLRKDGLEPLAEE